MEAKFPGYTSITPLFQAWSVRSFAPQLHDPRPLSVGCDLTHALTLRSESLALPCAWNVGLSRSHGLKAVPG